MKKHRPSVQLPDGDEIGTLEFAQLIAEAIRPNPEKCQGVDCIRCIYKETDYGRLPFKLSEAERNQLEELLPKLPPLRGKMFALEMEKFLKAYRKLPDKPQGELVLVSEHDVDEYRQAVEQLIEIHQFALRSRIASGKLNAYTQDRTPADGLGANVFISRSDAVRYLASIGLLEEAVSPVSTSVGKSKSSVIHSANGDAPYLWPGIRNNSRIAVKAAWHIQNEKKRPATPKETLTLLVEWWRTNSPLGEGIFFDFDEKAQELKWYTQTHPAGTSFTLADCEYAIKKWQKRFKDMAPL